MAIDTLALADMVKINDISIRDMGATDIFLDAPVMSALFAIEASHGTTHKYNKQSGAPTVGFRAYGDGRDHQSSSDTTVSVDLLVLDASFHLEAALADSHRMGAQYVIDREAMRHLRAAFKHGEKQIFYGSDNDAAGFVGLSKTTALDKIDDAMVISAGASSGGEYMDVWMLRTTSEETDVCVVVGNGGEINIGDWYKQMIDGANSKLRDCYVQPIEGLMGLQVGGAQSVARLVNLDARVGASANTLTDDLLSDLFELFPEEAPPTHIVMNKRGRKQLQQSRTATRPDGAPAPWPIEWEGIPIISTSSIAVYGTVVAAS